MTQKHPSVLRVQSRPRELGMPGEIHHLSDSARSAQEAADALGILVGQVASSIVVEKLHRADADFVRQWSGFAIGGVSPLAWLQPATVIIDEALNDYEVIWAAAGHPHAVFPITFDELIHATNAKRMIVGD